MHKETRPNKLHLISSIQTRPDKLCHAAVNHNEIFCPVGLHSSDTVDKATSVGNKRSSRFNDEIEVS